MSLRIALLTAGWLAGWWLFLRARLVPAVRGPAGRSPVAVVVPARDEDRNIVRLLDGLDAQLAPATEIVVVDDHSTDGTGRRAARPGVTVVTSAALPPGWTGKSWACTQGVGASAADVLVFLDADTDPAPGFLAAVLAERQRVGGVLTVQPFHRMDRWWERAAAIFNVVAVMGVGGNGAPGRTGRVVGAYGPCIVCRRADYEAVGGHAAVRASVVEDLDLGRRFLAAGVPVHARLGRGTIEFRMYASWRALVEGFTKNFAFGATGIPRLRSALIALWIAMLVAAVQVGVTAVTAGAGGAAAAAIYAGVVAQLLVLLRRLGNFGVATAVAFPIPLAVFVVVFVRSLVARVLGRVTWKGRAIPTRPSTA